MGNFKCHFSFFAADNLYAANSRYYEFQLGYINDIACISRCSHVPTIGGTDCVEEKIRNREADENFILATVDSVLFHTLRMVCN